MHVIIGEKLHDADYVANYTNGFEALAQRARASFRRSAWKN